MILDLFWDCLGICWNPVFGVTRFLWAFSVFGTCFYDILIFSEICDILTFTVFQIDVVIEHNINTSKIRVIIDMCENRLILNVFR